MYAEPPAGTAVADAQGLMSAQSLPYPSVPTSAAHLADQVESGGARLEETLLRMNCRYQTLFFCSALMALMGGTLAALASLAAFDLAALVNSIFLVVFGFILMLLDVPGSPRWAGRYRSMTRRYFRCLTRLTGRSLFLLFLGCLLSCTLSPSPRRSSSGGLLGGSSSSSSSGSSSITLFLSFCLSFFICSVSVIGLLISIRKSLRLERVRKSILLSQKGNYSEAYRKYALSDPAHGLQLEEFNRLSAECTAGRIQFDLLDLGIIFNALDEHQKSAINEREFTEWMTGTMTYL